MARPEKVILQVVDNLPKDIEGKTFQIHFLPNNRISLCEVKIANVCPVIIHGEACGKPCGHEGKHMWSGGD